MQIGVSSWVQMLMIESPHASHHLQPSRRVDDDGMVSGHLFPRYTQNLDRNFIQASHLSRGSKFGG